MNTHETTSTPNQVKIWDPLVRIFHWSLVATFAIAYLTGDEESRLHELAGYAVLGLVAIRIVWGFVGTRYARFRDFVYRPATVAAYAKDMLAGKPKRYLGHNPLGGVMIVALLLSLLATGATGYAAQQAEAGSPRLAAITAQVAAWTPDVVSQAVADDDEDERDGKQEGVWGEVHEFFANLTLLLVGLHVGGVLLGSLAHRENLVRAMFTGRKPV
ncbi:MAG: cytochrome b/b6 domain-containing protein [Bacteroidota bacterium]